jgi:hypothetical protein
MMQPLTADDVVQDIEFELIQGAITRNDLGQGIQAVKQYQAKLRTELFAAGQEMPPMREIVARQFQLNDMLITLLQEMAAATQEMQLKSSRLAHWQPVLAPTTAGSLPNALLIPQPVITTDIVLVEPLETETNHGRDTRELQQTLNDPLTIKLEMQPSNLPFWRRFKAEMHNLVLFYVRKLAERQTAINHTHTDWALYFNTLHQQQQQQIQQLQAQIAALQAEQSE